jgi:biotin synthase
MSEAVTETNPLAAAEQIIAGARLAPDTAFDISNAPLAELRKGADNIRRHFCGKHVSLCTIINAKSGKCAENCRYCAQSSHYHTDCDTYPLLDPAKILAAAHRNEDAGAHRFAIVTSGRAVSDEDFPKILAILRQLKKETRLTLCASLGLLTAERAKQLKDAGLSFFHHNLEACKEFFPHVCTTHTWQDRVDTIHAVQSAGLDLCSGGIFGLGETRRQRIAMAFELSELNVRSVPLNLLSPIPGTPFEHNKPLSVEEVLRSMAIYRFILPACEIRFAGGRKLLAGHFDEALLGGINAALTGDFLTTTGTTIATDLAFLKELGLDTSKER